MDYQGKATVFIKILKNGGERQEMSQSTRNITKERIRWWQWENLAKHCHLSMEL